MATFTEDDGIELELYRDLEIDALVEEALIPEDERLNVEMRNGFTLSNPEVLVEITTGHPYPAGPLECQVKNLTLPRIITDRLRVALRHSMQDDNETNGIKWTNRETNCEPFEMTALRIACKTRQLLTQYRNDLEKLEHEKETKKSKTDFNMADIWKTGLDLSTIEGHVSVNSLLGKTPGQICAGIPEYFRILHMESVIRGDLYDGFLCQQQELRKQLLEVPLPTLRRSVPVEVRRHLRNRSSEKESLVDHLVNPHLTFHGTRRDLVPSIIRHGFLLPGDPIPLSKEASVVRCGSTYGRGIYSSPSSVFSLAYSGYGASATKPNEYNGLKLIVCATVMGISATMGRDDNWRERKTPFPGSNSHVTQDQNEYIVFNRAQIIPCYVIHLDWGQDNVFFFEDIPTNSNAWVNRLQAPAPMILSPHLAPGDRQRVKKDLQSRAAKWFPYGYGPATGTSFVVEEVGDVDEDDEDYGEYQQERVDEALQGVGGMSIWDSIHDDGDENKDEYYDSRRAMSKRQGVYVKRASGI